MGNVVPHHKVDVLYYLFSIIVIVEVVMLARVPQLG